MEPLQKSIASLGLLLAACHHVETIEPPVWDGLGAFIKISLKAGSPPEIVASRQLPAPQPFTAADGEVTLAYLGYAATLEALGLPEGEIRPAVQGRPQRVLPRADRSWVQIAGAPRAEDQPLPEAIRELSIEAPGCQPLLGEEVHLPGATGHVRWLLPWNEGTVLVGASYFDQEEHPVEWTWTLVSWRGTEGGPDVTPVQIPLSFRFTVAFPGDGCVWIARTPAEGGCYAPVPGRTDWQQREPLPFIATSTVDGAVCVDGTDRPGARDFWWITDRGLVYRTTSTGTVLIDGVGNLDTNNYYIHLAWLGPGRAIVLQGNKITEHGAGQPRVYPASPGLDPFHRVSTETGLGIVVTTRDSQRGRLVRLDREHSKYTRLELTGDFVDIGDVAFGPLTPIRDTLFIPSDNGYLLELAPLELDDLGHPVRYDLCPVSQVGGGDLQFVVDDGVSIWAAGQREIDPIGEPVIYRIGRR